MTAEMPSSAAPAEAPATMSPFARAIAVFVRPTEAWVGLRERAQWWFPLLIVLLVSAGAVAALHQRAFVPMLLDQWDQAVADGQMTAQQVQGLERFFSGPGGLAFLAGQQVVMLPLFTLVVALLIWFGTGFVLGTRMRYRWALEVACWSGLISLPGAFLTYGIAWMRETFEGARAGFGLLLPEPETPSKLLSGLGVLLDGIGPLQVWWLVVTILGAAALSGAPRKSVAWVLSGIYAVVLLASAGLTALFTRGG